MRYGAKMQWGGGGGGALREVRHKDVCNGFLINHDVIECVCVCLHGYLWEIPTVSNSRDWHSGLTLYVDKAMFINSKG